MPRYFFNIYNDDVTIDDEGVELADVPAARSYAVVGARSLIVESVGLGHLTRHHRIEIKDESGGLLETVRFDEAIDIKP